MIERLRTARAAGLGPGGPLVRSTAFSLRRAMLLGLVVWHLLMVLVLVVAEARVAVGPLIGLHLGLAGLAAASTRGLVRFEVCVVLGYGVWALDYLAARSVDDVITLASCWLGNLLYLAPAIALRTAARTWIPLVGAPAVVAVLTLVGDPVWRLELASAFAVTAIAIVVAARLAMPALWGLAEDADRNVALLESGRRSEEVVRRASAEAAEDARLVHDTVINTLGAIADGAGGASRELEVRERCRRDLAVVEELLTGRRGHPGRDLATVGDGVAPVTVRRTGMSGADLDELQDVLGPAVVRALVGAAEESVRNAGKHAGVDAVTVDISRSGADVVLVVADRGRGFDPGTVPGRGIESSVRARVEEVGGEVTIASGPGRGTAVRISCPAAAGSTARTGSVAPTDVAEISDRLLRRACWLLGGGVVGVGVVIELANRPGRLTWTYAMLALVAASIATAYAAGRRTGRLPVSVLALLVLALPVGFLLTMAAIDFGRTDVRTYQAIGIAPLLVVLLAHGYPRVATLAGALLALTAGVLTTVRWLEAGEYGVLVLVAVAPSLGLAAGWAGFERLIRRVVVESEDARVQAEAASLELASRREIAEARRRWGTASLERSAGLLRGIGSGELDVSDSSVRSACAVEEAYLRQLLLLSPTAYRMSSWFANALAAARARGVDLTIRSGDLDAPDQEAAGVIGAVLLHSVAALPPGAALTVGWFPTGDGPRLVVVGAPSVSAAEVSVPASWEIVRTRLEDREMVEIQVA